MNNTYYSHRGFFDNETCFENTLEAFQISIAKGYGIELDIRITKDNILVVFHDATLKRLFDVDVEVESLTLQELYDISASKFHIPTFKEVLKLVNGTVDLIVEIKNGKRNKVLCQLVYDHLKSYNGSYCVESFHPYIVYWFKKHAPSIKRGQLLMSISEYESIALGIILLSHITSLLTRPHFYAYRKELGKSKLAKLLLNNKHKELVIWTLLEGDVLHLKADKIIFENCDNPEVLWPLNKETAN